MSDLGPLLAAVTDEWETTATIVRRAGMDHIEASRGFVQLIARGLVEGHGEDFHRLYRRDSNAPPLILPPTAEQILDGLRGKLDELELHEGLRNDHDEGFMACWCEVSAWLNAVRGS